MCVRSCASCTCVVGKCFLFILTSLRETDITELSVHKELSDLQLMATFEGANEVDVQFWGFSAMRFRDFLFTKTEINVIGLEFWLLAANSMYFQACWFRTKIVVVDILYKDDDSYYFFMPFVLYV